MSDQTIRGTVHVIEETKTYGRNGFRKRQVILEQKKGRYTNYVPLQFLQDSCDSVDQLNVGDEVEVTYRLSGRKWQRDENSEVKYFLDAEATSFSLQKGDGSSAPASSGPPEPDESEWTDDDEVPF